MRRIFIALALLAMSAGLATAQQSGGVKVSDPWARATPGRAPNGAAYLTITNGGTAADRLVSVCTPAAAQAEIHEEKMEGGVMQMRPVGPLTVEAGKSLTLKPGGYHVMLMGLKQPLKAGETLPLTLTFEKAGPQQVTATIGPAGAMGPAMGGDMSHMGHDMSQHKP